MSDQGTKLAAERARAAARRAESLVRDLRRMLGAAMAVEATAQKAAREAERAAT